MQINFHHRFIIFALVLLFHILVFYVVGNLIIFKNSVAPSPEASDGFLKIAVPPPVVPPPQAPDMPNPPAMTSPSGGFTSTMPLLIVANTIMPKFTVPMPSVNDPALNQHIEDSLRSSGLSGHGSGVTGSGAGSGDGTGSSLGDMADICGLNISTKENVVVIEDVWKAWHSTGDTATKVQRYADECISKFFFGITPVQVNGDLTYYNPQNNRVHSYGDLYEAAYPMEEAGPDGKAPTVMLFISTWVNVGETANLLPQEETLRDDATKIFVNSLRAHHIKLYLLSTNLAPYHVLADYARESGGQVSVTPELDLNHKK